MVITPADTLPDPDAADLAVLEPPQRRRGWIAAAAVGTVAIVAAVWWFGGSDGVVYETSPIGSGSLTQRITAVGQLEPTDTVEVSSDLTGKIEQVLVDENAAVAADQVLALLDPTPFETSVAQQTANAASARANLKKARVDLDRAEQELARTTRLEARGAETRVALETAQLDVASARASVEAAAAAVDQARAALDQAEEDLDDTVVRSPVAGVVIRREVDPGQTVVSALAATPLFEVASDLGELKVDVEVDEADVGRVHAGQAVAFTVSAWPDRVFEAEVASLDLAADTDNSVVVFDAEIRVRNPDLALRPGMTATAEITVGTVDDALLVPSTALRYRPPEMEAPDGDHIWTLQDGKPTPVSVRVLGDDGTQTALLADGLEPDAAVILGGGR